MNEKGEGERGPRRRKWGNKEGGRGKKKREGDGERELDGGEMDRGGKS